MKGKVKCTLCHDVEEVDEGRRGAFVGPVQDGPCGKAHYVHRACALWSAEVFQTERNTFKNLLSAVKRGRRMKCKICKRQGATLGCHIDRCMAAYHLDCAKQGGCTFSIVDYSIGCPKHPHKDKWIGTQKKEGITPAGTERLTVDALAPWRVVEKEHGDGEMLIREDWVTSFIEDDIDLTGCTCCGDPEEVLDICEDADNRFREETLLRFKPIIIGGQMELGDDPQAEALVQGAHAGFDCIGGLEDVVKSLREMVLLPLLYPELFYKVKLQRGILLHGPPGTGKTHLVRCLVSECAKYCDSTVAFFSHKASECLSENVGESEEALRILFEEAQRLSPSIIFLDELDALMPPRGSEGTDGDAHSASVVATVLSLMDGLEDHRGVTVIGATNRPEAIDPALRRSGRFDREVLFHLPDAEERAAILRVHTHSWRHQPDEGVIEELADATEHMTGADLKHLCVLAVMKAVHLAVPGLLNMFPKDIAQLDSGLKSRRLIWLSKLKVTSEAWTQALQELLQVKGMHPMNGQQQQPLLQPLLPVLLAPLAMVLVSIWERRSRLCTALEECGHLASLYLKAKLESEKSNAREELCERLAQEGAVASATDINGSRRKRKRESSQSGILNKRHKPSSIEQLQPQCHVLVCGEGDFGQDAVAQSALCVLSELPKSTVTLPCLLERGERDLLQACRSMITKSLAGLTPGKPWLLYIPRIETWTGVGYNLNNFSRASEDDASDAASISATVSRSVSEQPSGLFSEVCSEVLGQRDLGQAGGFEREGHLSDLWVVFEELIAELPPSQPIIILATSHRPLSGIPPSVVGFFESNGSAPLHTVDPSTASSMPTPTIIEMHQNGYCPIRSREAERAAEVLKDWCGGEAVRRSETALIGVGEDPALQDKSNKLHRYCLRPRDDHKARPQNTKRDTEQKCLSDFGKLCPGSAMEQATDSVRQYGSALLEDPRVRLVHFLHQCQKPSGRRAGFSNGSFRGFGQRGKGFLKHRSLRGKGLRSQWVSLQQVAKAASEGKFSTPTDFCQAVERVVRPLRTSRNPLQKRWQRWLGYAILDEINEWAWEMTQTLGFTTSSCLFSRKRNERSQGIFMDGSLGMETEVDGNIS